MFTAIHRHPRDRVALLILALAVACNSGGQVQQLIPIDRFEAGIGRLIDWEQFWVGLPPRTADREKVDATILVFTVAGNDGQLAEKAEVFVTAIARRFLFERRNGRWESARGFMAIQQETALSNSEAIEQYKIMFESDAKFGAVYQTRISIPEIAPPSCISESQVSPDSGEFRRVIVQELQEWITQGCSRAARVSIPRYCKDDPQVHVLLEDPCEVDSRVAIFTWQESQWVLEMPPRVVLSGTTDFRYTEKKIRTSLLEWVVLEPPGR